MKKVNWNEEKAALIKKMRDIDLERVATMIEENKILEVKKSHHRTNQKVFALQYDDYIIAVPFVETDHEIFIKTAFRSRKLQKRLKME